MWSTIRQTGGATFPEQLYAVLNQLEPHLSTNLNAAIVDLFILVLIELCSFSTIHANTPPPASLTSSAHLNPLPVPPPMPLLHTFQFLTLPQNCCLRLRNRHCLPNAQKTWSWSFLPEPLSTKSPISPSSHKPWNASLPHNSNSGQQ